MYETGHRWGPVSLALAIAAGLVVGGIALSAAFWLLGILAGFVFAVLKVAVLIGLAALVVWGVRALFRDHSTICGGARRPPARAPALGPSARAAALGGHRTLGRPTPA